MLTTRHQTSERKREVDCLTIEDGYQNPRMSFEQLKDSISYCRRCTAWGIRHESEQTEPANLLKDYLGVKDLVMRIAHDSMRIQQLRPDPIKICFERLPNALSDTREANYEL